MLIDTQASEKFEPQPSWSAARTIGGHYVCCVTGVCVEICFMYRTWLFMEYTFYFLSKIGSRALNFRSRLIPHA